MTPYIDATERRLDLIEIADVLSDPRVEDYLTGNRQRLATTRAILELFRIPFPMWAKRSVTGRTNATKAAIERWDADYAHKRYTRTAA